MANVNKENIPLHIIDNFDEYRRIFNRVDANQDGKICINELHIFIQVCKDECKVIPKHIVKKIHKMADKDENTNLNFDEFRKLITQKAFQQLLGRYVNQYIHLLIPHPHQVVPEADEEEQRLIDQYTCFPPPMFMLMISLLEFIFYWTDEINKPCSTLAGSGIFSDFFIYNRLRRYQAWRYLTYIFVHIGYQHLWANLAVQLFLGVPLEMVHKWWRILVIYCTGGIAGSLAHSVIDSGNILGGASGSVYALLTAHIANVILNWGQMTYPAIQLIFFGMIVTVDVGPSLYQKYYLKTGTNIGVAAHFGGAMAGLLVGIYILRNLKITNTEKHMWWMALILYILLMGAGIMINMF